MPKLPRNLSGRELCVVLAKIGYKISRQTGSHIRLTDNNNHSITIPDHNPVKIGTLNNILNDISTNMGISKQDIINKLF
jgi:predicted RNA binding protein YcfA (HicA-like mRNA interferase family)